MKTKGILIFSYAVIVILLFLILRNQKKVARKAKPPKVVYAVDSQKGSDFLTVDDLLPKFKGSVESIVLGFEPFSDPMKIKSQADKLIKGLEKIDPGLKLNAVVGSSLADVTDGLKEGAIQGAFLTPVSFVESHLGLIPTLKILRKGELPGYYFSAIVAASGNVQMQHLSDLCGKKMGYTDMSSDAGYLYPRVALQKALAKIKGCRVTEVFLGDFLSILMAIEKHEIDAGAVFTDWRDGKQGAWTRLGNKKYQVRVLAFSEPIPSDGFFLKDNIPQETRKRITQAIVKFQKTPEGAALFKELYGVERFATPKRNEYVKIRRTLDEAKKLRE